MFIWNMFQFSGNESTAHLQISLKDSLSLTKQKVNSAPSCSKQARVLCAVTRKATAAVQWPLSSTSTNALPTHGKESHLVRNCLHLRCVAFNSESQRMEVTTVYTQIF
ncbi:rCG46356 [Rattus norvegicus]|uniref:RCG46356 n=1 Tax=Rattus norvegicus TaxID=10116 RepID=A6ICU3_RAT|nr:rCG46356 [Rattus norvegicus]